MDVHPTIVMVSIAIDSYPYGYPQTDHGFSHGIRLLSEGVQFSTDAYAVAAVEMPYFSLVNYVEFVQRFKCIAGLYIYALNGHHYTSLVYLVHILYIYIYIYIPGSSFVAQFWVRALSGKFQQISAQS